MMQFEWDEKKREINLLKHGLDFVDAQMFFDQRTLLQVDSRFDYGEKRYYGIGRVNGREVVLIFTCPGSNRIRVISFRKANKREVRCYHEDIKNRLEAF